MLLAGAIFVLTIVLVIWQPKGLGIGWSAMLGAGLALISGVVHVGDIPVVWNIVWNATATFIAVIIISLLLDESGFFEWAALHVSRWGNGRGRLLFTYIVLLCAALCVALLDMSVFLIAVVGVVVGVKMLLRGILAVSVSFGGFCFITGMGILLIGISILCAVFGVYFAKWMGQLFVWCTRKVTKKGGSRS